MKSDFTRGRVFTQIRECLEKLKMEYNAEYHAVLYTAMGKVVCDLEPPAAKNSLLGFVDDPTTFTVDISALFDGSGAFDEELINAKNVVIYENNADKDGSGKNSPDKEIMRVEQMILFADQILGFSLIRQQTKNP